MPQNMASKKQDETAEVQTIESAAATRYNAVPKLSKRKRGTKRSATEAAVEQQSAVTSIDLVLHPHWTSFNVGARLTDAFYDVPCQTLAKSLLGQILVRCLPDGTLLRCKIVETECYLGGEDKASHSFNGRRTERNEAMFMKPGTSYLHRAAHRKPTAKAKSLKPHELCNGPSKLCMSLAIERFMCNKQDLCQFSGMWIERGEGAVAVASVVTSHRIGIESVGGEWSTKPLRFYLLGNNSVSKRDKISEQSKM
ncbi:hypothetical protein B566_EDAN015332 [Ephemera danica]|nr:hypothetical protein B566_EDAN015332 [Ephemera danica]